MTENAVFPLTALTAVNVSVKLEPQGGAATAVCLTTHGERTEAAAPVQFKHHNKYIHNLLMDH